MIRRSLTTALASPALALWLTACDGISPVAPQDTLDASAASARVWLSYLRHNRSR